MTTTDVPRRTQAERRAATRAALLEATIDVLVAQGYAGTTTTEVCRRAGVSQGALFKHFATKADLLAAALEELFPRLRTDFHEAFTQAACQDDPLTVALATLRDVYRRPETQAALELYAAARTDRDLAQTLLGVEGPHRDAIVVLAADVLPEAAERLGPTFGPTVNLVLDTMLGMTLSTGFMGARWRDDQFELFQGLAEHLLSTP